MKTGLLATAIALVLGTLASLAVARHRFFGRETISFLVILPIALPGIVTGIALNSTFTQVLGIDLSLFTIVVAHATFCIVVVYNNVIARLRRLSGSFEEASADLGASPWQTFRFVTLPNMRTALVAGALLAFALSFDEIIVTTFTVGAGDQTLPIWILTNFSRPNQLPIVNAVAVLVILISIIPVYLAHRLTREEGTTVAAGGRRRDGRGDRAVRAGCAEAGRGTGQVGERVRCLTPHPSRSAARVRDWGSYATQIPRASGRGARLWCWERPAARSPSPYLTKRPRRPQPAPARRDRPRSRRSPRRRRIRSAAAPSTPGWPSTTCRPRPSSSATRPRARVSASARELERARVRAALEDPLVEHRLAVEEARREGGEELTRSGQRVELVEQAALLVLGARRHPEVDREAQLVGGIREGADRLGAALGVALHRVARDVEQQVVEVGVVVEDRARREAGALGDVLDPQADRPALEQHAAGGGRELGAPCAPDPFAA